MLRLALIVWLALCGAANAQLSGGLQFPGPGTAHSAGSAGPPSATYIKNLGINTGSGSASISVAGLNVFTAAANVELVIFISSNPNVAILASPTPTLGGINCPLVRSDGTNVAISILQCVVPNGTNLTSATLTYTLASGIFDNSNAVFYSIPTADLNSTTPVTATATNASSTSASITTLPTLTGGTVIAHGISADTTGGTTWTGIIASGSGNEDYDTVANALTQSAGHADGLSASGGATVTATFTGAGGANRVTAATWR